MGKSGIEWIDTLFDWSVIFLYDVAQLLDISYEEVNVWLFVIILPTALFVLLGSNVVLLWRLRGRTSKKFGRLNTASINASKSAV